MASVVETVQQETEDAAQIADHNMMHLADKLYKELSRVPLHIHKGVVEVLNTRTNNRHMAMQMEAMEKQRQFEEDRRKDHERMLKDQAEKKPPLQM